MLKCAPESVISGTPSISIRILTPQPLDSLSHPIPKIICRCTAKGISWLGNDRCFTTSLNIIILTFFLFILSILTALLLYWAFPCPVFHPIGLIFNFIITRRAPNTFLNYIISC